jgi:tetratricopeptide (TPR) repeat protein
VELIQLLGGRTNPINEDFRLKVDKRFVSTRPTITGTVFAQDVPVAAKKLYDSAMDAVDADNSEKAIKDLRLAIEAFPTYFDALGALGKKLILDGKSEEGYPYLLKAVDVNKKCPDCFFTLAVGFAKMDQIPAALQSAEYAVVLQAGIPEYQLLFGSLLRQSGDLPRAEKALLAAKAAYKEPNPEVFWQLSMVYNKTDRNSESADALEAFIKYKPDLEKQEKQKIKEMIAKMRKVK